MGVREEMSEEKDRFAECSHPLVIIATVVITVIATLGLWGLITRSIIIPP